MESVGIFAGTMKLTPPSFIFSISSGPIKTNSLKNRCRFAFSGISKPHCQPLACFRSSVGTLRLLFAESAAGQVETTC